MKKKTFTYKELSFTQLPQMVSYGNKVHIEISHGARHSRTQSPSYARRDEGLWPNP